MTRLRWLLLPFVALLLDVLSKAWILAHLAEGQTRPVVKGFFYLSLGYNRGAIFGSLHSAPEWLRGLLFTSAALVALVYFGRAFLAEATPTLERIALGLILGGSMGNALDRLRHGAVVDFLDFVFGGWHYWTFNLADSFIVVGALLYGFHLLRHRDPIET